MKTSKLRTALEKHRRNLQPSEMLDWDEVNELKGGEMAKKRTAVEIALRTLNDDEREWTLIVGKTGARKTADASRQRIEDAALQLTDVFRSLPGSRDRGKAYRLCQKLLTALEAS